LSILLKSFKYRIYPIQEQMEQIHKTFGCVRFVYNYYLNKKNDLYKNGIRLISKIDCNNHANRELKNEFEWLREVDKFSLTNSIYNLDSAYQKFFKEKTGYPKFKSKNDNRQSYTTNWTSNNIRVDFDNNKIRLPKLDWVNAKVHRQFQGQIKSATISKTPRGKYFVSILVDIEIEQLPICDNLIGFDLGIKEFIVDSNNSHIDNPKTLYKYEQKLAKLSRKLSKKKKGSKNSNKARIKVATLHEKIANVRKDFLHKLSSQIINENQVIISENLQVKNMVKNHKLAKAISDVSWGEFTRQLGYKANWYGRTYHKIDKWFASSQTCSDCGIKNQAVKLLSVREWACENCGSVHHRDENAAKNILAKGLQELKLA
jgi:putative transposase